MTDRPLILIVDDEPQIQRFLGHALAASGYETVHAATGGEGLRIAASHDPAAVIVDLGLPDLNGKVVIERLRAVSEVPIIVLSAHDQEMEKIMALDLGANDFVAKPFGIGELLARLRASLRVVRKGAETERIVRGDLVIDLAGHAVTLAGVAVGLTPKEFDLLVALARAPGRVMTHRQLLQQVWGPAHVDDVPYLRVFVGQLRQKIEADPAHPVLVLTEPGVGYRFASES
jgi:two-component system KDP operon response regulator KdpE